MKRIFLLCMMLAAANAPAQGPAPSAIATPRLDTKLGTTPSRIVPVDRIIAVVNDEVITQNDLTDRVALVVRQLQRQGGQLPAQDVLTRQILDRMVNDLVQIQMAKENGIKIDDVTLDKTIQRIADENNLSMSDFRATLEKDGIRYVRFREDIRNEVLLARLREREVDQTVVVTDAEVETELARIEGARCRQRIPPGAHPRHGSAAGHAGPDRGPPPSRAAGALRIAPGLQLRAGRRHLLRRARRPARRQPRLARLGPRARAFPRRDHEAQAR